MVELPALQRALDLSSGVAARRSLFWSSSPVQSAGWPALAQPAARPSAQIARIGFATAEQVQRLAESLDVSHVEREAGYVVALVTAGEGERLEAQGHTVDADEALTATLSAVAGFPASVRWTGCTPTW